MPLINSLLSTALLASVTSAHPSHHDDGFNWKDTKHLLAFGDSYTYVQGTAGRQNATFIGDYLNLPYNRSQLLNNYIVQSQTGTAEGGPNWVEFLTGCGLKPGLNDPKTCDMQLWDFAFGGADISADYLPRHHNYSVQLDEQVQQFLTYGEPVLSDFVNKDQTLVAIWIGINDINDSASMDLDFPDFYNTIIAALFASMQKLLDTGYKHFLFVNLPPLDRTPGNNERDGEPSPTKQMIEQFNQALHNQSQTFGHDNAGASVLNYDANTFLNGVMDRPGKFGIRDVEGYCEAYDQPYVDTDAWYYGCLPLEEYL